MSKLILGTAQFGDKYGILNNSGALSDEEIQLMAKLALDSNVHLFDTSPFYGNAEERIRELVSPLGEVSVITKFALPEDEASVSASIFSDRFETLSPVPVAGLLFHRVEDLRDSRLSDAWDLLKQAQKEGKVSKIGASIYGPDDLKIALTTLQGINLLQIPGSVIDQRLLNDPLLQEFHSAGGTIHVRSAYLQGLLLSEPGSLPDEFKELVPALEALRQYAYANDTTLPSLLLGFLKNHPLVDGVVVGALSQDEFRDTLTAWESAVSPQVTLPQISTGILDPRLWQRNNT